MQIKLAIAAIMATAAVSAIPQGPIQPCTDTITKVATFNLSPITTIWLATHTATASVDCHGCAAIYTKTIGGPGPVLPSITATLLDNNIGGTTTTTTVCSATGPSTTST